MTVYTKKESKVGTYQSFSSHLVNNKDPKHWLLIVVDDLAFDDFGAQIKATWPTRPNERILNWVWDNLRPECSGLGVNFIYMRNDRSQCAPMRTAWRTGYNLINHCVNNTDAADYYNFERQGSFPQAQYSPFDIWVGPWEYDLAWKAGLSHAYDGNPTHQTLFSGGTRNGWNSSTGVYTNASVGRNSPLSGGVMLDGASSTTFGDDHLQLRTGNLFNWLSEAGVVVGMAGKYQNGFAQKNGSGTFANFDAYGTISTAKTSRKVPPGFDFFYGTTDDQQDHYHLNLCEFSGKGTNSGGGDGKIGTNTTYIYDWIVIDVSWAAGVATITHAVDMYYYRDNAKVAWPLSVGDEIVLDGFATAGFAWSGIYTVASVDIPNRKFTINVPVNPGTTGMVKTTVAAGSNNVHTNTFTGTQTLNVASNVGFTTNGTVMVRDNASYTYISYTGKSGTTGFTNCVVVGSGSTDVVLTTGMTVSPIIAPGNTGDVRVYPSKMWCEEITKNQVVDMINNTGVNEPSFFYWTPRSPHGGISYSPDTNVGFPDPVSGSEDFDPDLSNINADNFAIHRKYFLNGNWACNTSDGMWWNTIPGTYSPAVVPSDYTGNNAHSKMVQQRYSMVASLNEQIQSLVQAMWNKYGQDDVGILFCTDNGYQLGDQTFNIFTPTTGGPAQGGESAGTTWSPVGGKLFVYDHSLRLGLWMRHPNYNAQKFEKQCAIYDLAATIMDLFSPFYPSLAGHHIHMRDGVSLIRLIRDGSSHPSWNRALWGHGYYQQSASNQGFHTIDQNHKKLVWLNTDNTVRQRFDMTRNPLSPYGCSLDWETINLDLGLSDTISNNLQLFGNDMSGKNDTGDTIHGIASNYNGRIDPRKIRTDSGCVLTNGNKTVTDASVVSTDIGAFVISSSGGHIQAGSRIYSVDTVNHTFTMDLPATGSGTESVVIQQDNPMHKARIA